MPLEVPIRKSVVKTVKLDVDPWHIEFRMPSEGNTFHIRYSRGDGRPPETEAERYKEEKLSFTLESVKDLRALATITTEIVRELDREANPAPIHRGDSSRGDILS